jgi:CRISPR-associated protein Cas5h
MPLACRTRRLRSEFMQDILAFDVWGDYAHFKKYFTTTSPLTFSVPPRTALIGLVGAICGLPKDRYIDALASDRADVAVSILTPITKVRLAENLIDTKTAVLMSRIKNRTQIRFEFIKDARYRIYVSLANPAMYERLKELLCAHKSVYTPCLGLSEHIANFAYVGEYHAKPTAPDDFVNVSSVARDECITELDIELGKEYFSEVVPREMNGNRVPLSYSKVIYERNGKALRAQIKDGCKIEHGAYIVFL